MFQGIGYQEYKDMRTLNEGLKSGELEDPGNERFLIYFGRLHLSDHQTGLECRGPLKIGRGKFATALMRGRNQPGGDFRIYGEIIVSENIETEVGEKIIKKKLKHRNIVMSQGQQELYDIEDYELEDIIKEISELINRQCNVIEVKTFKNGFPVDLSFNKGTSLFEFI